MSLTSLGLLERSLEDRRNLGDLHVAQRGVPHREPALLIELAYDEDGVRRRLACYVLLRRVLLRCGVVTHTRSVADCLGGHANRRDAHPALLEERRVGGVARAVL